jgi:hypothetical protein
MNTLVDTSFVGMNGSRDIPVSGEQAVLYATKRMGPSRTFLECYIAELQRGCGGCCGDIAFITDSR